jgi:hypothetical protein
MYSPKLIPFVEKNQGKICWTVLSSNLNAISFLEKNQDKIDASLILHVKHNFIRDPKSKKNLRKI